jgi:hypothetical protein
MSLFLIRLPKFDNTVLVKVKFALEQAIKAQRRIRVIALLIL